MKIIDVATDAYNFLFFLAFKFCKDLCSVGGILFQIFFHFHKSKIQMQIEFRKIILLAVILLRAELRVDIKKSGK